MGTHCLAADYEISDETVRDQQTVFPVAAILLFVILPAFSTLYAVRFEHEEQNRNRCYCSGGIILDLTSFTDGTHKTIIYQ